MFKSLVITRFDSRNFWEQLYERVVSPYLFENMQEKISKLGLSQIKDKIHSTKIVANPLNKILNDLGKPLLACKTAIFEDNYIDKDYLSEFSNFYSKTFKIYPSRCTRIHFFSDIIPTRTKIVFHRYKRSYLGYMIIRPSEVQKVGRTILKPPLSNDNSQFINCKKTYKSHIYGEDYEVEGMPFIQQDSALGVCAHSALWMVARYMSHAFGTVEYTPGDINKLASSIPSWGVKSPPGRGLFPSQIVAMIYGMGFWALYYHLHSLGEFESIVEKVLMRNKVRTPKKLCAAKFAELTYRYIESCLPVILITDKPHAIVCIGHQYNYQAKVRAALLRIPTFYAHDDCRGPYIEIPIFSKTSKIISFQNIVSIIAIMPREVTVPAERAEPVAIRHIMRFLAENDAHRTVRDALISMRPEFKSWLSNLEYRTYLRYSNSFINELKQVQHNSIIRHRLLRIDYPKYVWITEISSSALLSKANKHERKCLGMVVIDSTGPPRAEGIIFSQFCDHLSISDRQGNKPPERIVVPYSTPIVHKLW